MIERAFLQRKKILFVEVADDLPFGLFRLVQQQQLAVHPCDLSRAPMQLLTLVDEIPGRLLERDDDDEHRVQDRERQQDLLVWFVQVNDVRNQRQQYHEQGKKGDGEIGQRLPPFQSFACLEPGLLRYLGAAPQVLEGADILAAAVRIL